MTTGVSYKKTRRRSCMVDPGTPAGGNDGTVSERFLRANLVAVDAREVRAAARRHLQAESAPGACGRERPEGEDGPQAVSTLLELPQLWDQWAVETVESGQYRRAV